MSVGNMSSNYFRYKYVLKCFRRNYSIKYFHLKDVGQNISVVNNRSNIFVQAYIVENMLAKKQKALYT